MNNFTPLNIMLLLVGIMLMISGFTGKSIADILRDTLDKVK